LLKTPLKDNKKDFCAALQTKATSPTFSVKHLLLYWNWNESFSPLNKTMSLLKKHPNENVWCISQHCLTFFSKTAADWPKVPSLKM